MRLDAEEEGEDVLKRGCGVGKSIEVGVGDMELSLIHISEPTRPY